jgi:colanic acid/amylovoran biosynthesis protein
MLKKPIVMFPNSVGPFQSSVGKLLAKLTFNKFSIVLLRESISYELVKNMKLNSNLVLSGDAALLYEVSSKSAENNKYNYSVMGISPGFYSHILSKREIENYIEIHARTIDYVIGKYGLHVHLLPHYVSGFENDDLEISKKIYGCVKNKEYVSIIITGSLHEFKEELNQLELHISSKMHPTILATSNFIPAISVAYDHKQIGFYKNLDIEGMIVDLKKLKYDDFVHEIDLAWSTRNQLESKLKEKVPMLQKRILNSMKYAIESYCL